MFQNATEMLGHHATILPAPVTWSDSEARRLSAMTGHHRQHVAVVVFVPARRPDCVVSAWLRIAAGQMLPLLRPADSGVFVVMPAKFACSVGVGHERASVSDEHVHLGTLCASAAAREGHPAGVEDDRGLNVMPILLSQIALHQATLTPNWTTAKNAASAQCTKYPCRPNFNGRRPTTSAVLANGHAETAGHGLPDYSHSMVPGGLLVMSRATRLTPGTSLVIRVEIVASTSYCTRTQSAVIASSEDTGRSTTGWP